MSYKILVVDDTNFMRKMAADFLKQYGYDVVGEAANGREAVKKYEELRPDIVMMDLTMPEMNGIDAIKEILKINPDAVVLVCSASNQQELIFNALDAGAKGYLMKPFNKDRMNEIILKYAVPHLISDNSESAEAVSAHSTDRSDPEQESSVADYPEEDQLENVVPDEQSSILDTDTLFEYAAAVEFQSVQSDNDATVQHREDEGLPEDGSGEELALEQDTVSELTKEEREDETEQTAGVVQPLEYDGQNEPEIVSSAEAESKSSEEVKTMNSIKRNRISFVTSYMCNWQEEINGETTNFSVTCTENDNKILIEMTSDSNEKQNIQFTLDGFRQLIDWLEDQLGSRTANVLQLTKRAD